MEIVANTVPMTAPTPVNLNFAAIATPYNVAAYV